MKQIDIYVDGGSRGNPGKSAAAFVVIESGKIITKKGFYIGVGTNNEAEYSSVIYALRWLVENNRDYSGVNIILDSELVTKQLRGQFKIRSKNLMSLMRKAKELEDKVTTKINYKNIPREKNRLADHVVNKVLDDKQRKKSMKKNKISRPSAP